MVRVFSIYQFDGQTIHRIPGDIQSASLIDANHLALAKSDHVIEIVNLQNDNFDSTQLNGLSCDQANDSNIQTKYAFPTVDEVVEMVYCKFGNFIATIERKVSNTGAEHFGCRVYTNWSNCMSASNDTDNINLMTCNVTIRARIAGRVTPSTNNLNCLEVIEIPAIVRSCSQSQSNNTYKLAVCQRMGTIVCAKDRFLKFYKFDECINENTHFKYIDFIEVPFEVELDFCPMHLTIHEHIVGCANMEYMCVFQIVEQNFYNTANSLTTSSELSAMAAIPICPFPESTEPMLDYQNVSKKFLASITSNISSTFDYHVMDTNSERGRIGRDRSIELKPNFLDKTMPLCNLRHFPSTNDEAYKDYSVRILVQVKQHDANDPFQCLVLSPIYSRKQKVLDTSNIFRSHYSGGFVGISILLATVNEGYLYQFSNNEKWILNESDVQSNGLIATYSFTSPIISVCVTDYVIHALTDHGIETYTHCIGHKLFNNAYEYGLSDDSYTSETSPRIEEQICLIGLRPFLGVQRIFHTPHNLILLARSHNSPLNDSKTKAKSKLIKNVSAESSPSWTLYNLRMSPANVLYRDFIELAANHKTELTELITSQNSDKVRIFALLLSEGHVILRIAKDVYVGELNETTANSTKTIEQLFLESCHQLGDFYVMSQNRDQYCLAYPYYLMGNLTIDQVYNRIMSIIGDIPQDSETMKGSIHTLKSMIVKSTEANEELARRLSSFMDSTKNQTFGDKLLEFIGKYAPSDLAVIGLNSITFRDTMGNKMCDAILQTNGSDLLSKEDKLIVILDSIRSDRKNTAKQLLDTFNPAELHQLLVSNWSILFETTKIKRTGKSMTNFSELMESYLLPISATNHGIRIALLATFRNLLIDTNALSIEVILKLLMDFLASHFGQISLYTSVQSILENLLEAYFHRLYVVRRYSDTLSSASQEMLIKNGIDVTTKWGNNNDSLASTSSENVTASIGMTSNSGQRNDSCQSDTKGSTLHTNGGNNDSISRKHPHNLFSSSFNVEALKILTRIYLSSLKACTLDFEIKSKEKPTYLKYVKFLRENFNKVYSHHISQNTNGDGKSSAIDESKYCNDSGLAIANGTNQPIDIQLTKIPILFLLQRPSFLNTMPPIRDDDTSDGPGVARKHAEFNCNTDQGRKAIGVVLKLQSLLSSGILTRDILQEVLHFIETNLPFFGIDSFFTLLMPFEMCVDYLIEMRPEYLLEYAKCAAIDDQRWKYVIAHITMQFDRIAQNRSQAFFETLLKDHLDYLVHTKRLPDILNIIPMKYFDEVAQIPPNAQTNQIDNESNVDENQKNDEIFSMENNNNAIFTAFLKLAIDTDRSERLNEMIKTTGFQLYNTFIGGNNPVADN